MKKLLILGFCLLFSACAGNRTLDGETTKNWVKIVSSKVDRSGNVQDVCYILDLSFYPGTVYERLNNDPNTCLEECCWYSENQNVDFYFNDGFARDLEENGVSRRYYPDHIQINMTYAPFLNRLSAKASSQEGISKDGVVMLEYEDIRKPDLMNDKSLYEIKAKDFSGDTSARKNEVTSYKTRSISGLNREELLERARNERDRYAMAESENYEEDDDEDYEEDEDQFIEESLTLRDEVLPADENDGFIEDYVATKSKFSQKTVTKKENFEQEDSFERPIQKNSIKTKQKQVTVKRQKANINNDAENTMYDVQRTLSQEAAIVYVDPVMPEPVDEETLMKKLKYERDETIKLLKRFYGDEIDGYLHSLDKAEKQKGRVLFTNNKVWQAQKIGTTVYKVNCDVKGKIVSFGSNGEKQTKDYPIACGTYIVNLDEKTVEAKDSLAKKIAKKKY